MPRSLHVEQTGVGSDLFLLHGWMINSHCWDGLFARPRNRFRLTKVDLPGYGGSVQSAYSFANPDRLLTHLLELAPEKAIWVGWSLGGLLAQMAMRKAPDQIRALVSVSMGSRYLAAKDWSQGVNRALFRAFGSLFKTDPEQAMRQFIEQQVLGSEHEENTRGILRSIAHMAWDKKELTAGLELLRVADIRRAAQTFKAPALFIAGEKDTVVNAESLEQSVQLMPHGRYIEIAGAGHAPFLSHAGEFLEGLHGFIDEAI